MLTSQIKNVGTIKELLQKQHAHESDLDHIHLSACWVLLGRLVTQRTAERHWLQDNSKALDLLVQGTVRAAVARDIGARELANIAYGAGHAFATLG